MGDDFIHKTGKMLQADCLAASARLERKSTKAGKNLVKSLEASRAVRATGVEDVGTFGSADCIAVGVHLQEVNPLVVAALLFSFLLAQVFVAIPKKFRDITGRPPSASTHRLAGGRGRDCAAAH